MAEDDGHVNMYQWSIPPGLREEAEDVAQTIRHATKSFKRTTSAMSSSSSSSTVTGTKHKKKVNNNNSNDTALTTKDKAMPPPPLASTITICDTFDTPDKDVNLGQKSNSKDKHQPTLTTTSGSTTTSSSSTDIHTLLEENNVLREKLSSMTSLEEENKVLHEKILSIEDEMFYLRNTLISKYRFVFNVLFNRSYGKQYSNLYL